MRCDKQPRACGAGAWPTRHRRPACSRSRQKRSVPARTIRTNPSQQPKDERRHRRTYASKEQENTVFSYSFLVIKPFLGCFILSKAKIVECRADADQSEAENITMHLFPTQPILIHIHMLPVSLLLSSFVLSIARAQRPFLVRDPFWLLQSGVCVVVIQQTHRVRLPPSFTAAVCLLRRHLSRPSVGPL